MEKAAGARKLLAAHSQGVLCTLSSKREGYPFGSVTPYALDAAGRPVFLVSSMALHTKNVLANPKASLLVAEQATGEEMLSAARANLLGSVRPVPEAESDEVRALYLQAHPSAAQWVDFGDFGFYRMEIEEIYYVGGFGVMGWVSGSDFSRAV